MLSPMSNITEMSPQAIQARLEEMKIEADVAGRNLHRIATTVDKEHWGLFPVRTGFGGELFLARVQGDPLMGSGKYIATQDGGPALLAAWDSDSDGEDVVYVEVWDRYDRRSWHGYVDATSRKIVQEG